MRRRLADSEFLKEKRVAGLEERGERTSAAEMNTYVGKLLVKVADDVEDERGDKVGGARQGAAHGGIRGTRRAEAEGKKGT
jgi:hypothetical protein